MQFNIEVNNRLIEVRKGETILSALYRNGIKVPTLCNMKDLSPTGACRICVVEVEGKENLVTSCSYPVEESMKIKTHSPRVVKARKTLVELLLSNHPDDCLYCERNGCCELQDLAIDLNIRERRISGKKSRHKLDLSSPSIVRDPAKCILCGRCVRVCDEIQSVCTLDFLNRGSKTIIGTAMARDLNFSSCINCGRCVMVCPTGALHEHGYLDEVLDSLNNPALHVVVQYGPAVTVSLAEEFGIKAGKDINGVINAALRKIGFAQIFDTAFGADLAVMETVELIMQRLETGEGFPVISSCCPAWVKYAEQFYPDILPYLSTCKSPQQMLGSIIKSYYAPQNNINPNSIYSVAIMPCLAKKFEAQREEMTHKAISDVDVVITTRELSRLIKMYGIDIQNIDPQTPDSPFGTRSSAGKLFGTAGGTTEAILRTLHYRMTGKELNSSKWHDLRFVSGIKEIPVKIGGKELKIVLANGLTGIEKLVEGILNKTINAHFVEIMTCPGGCVNGGGQPFKSGDKDVKARTRSLYEIDEVDTIKAAHKNPLINELYEKFLEKPGSDKAKQQLHTCYTKRDVLL
ncbi:MAG: 4Fe-4S dicluster domain-containing protein [Bacteroidales bacterium]|nr:MAG: 4Fe-4S dicluster domain-containing protein [Bacteroidales bacterium]